MRKLTNLLSISFFFLIIIIQEVIYLSPPTAVCWNRQDGHEGMKNISKDAHFTLVMTRKCSVILLHVAIDKKKTKHLFFLDTKMKTN